MLFMLFQLYSQCMVDIKKTPLHDRIIIIIVNSRPNRRHVLIETCRIFIVRCILLTWSSTVAG